MISADVACAVPAWLRLAACLKHVHRVRPCTVHWFIETISDMISDHIRSAKKRPCNRKSGPRRLPGRVGEPFLVSFSHTCSHIRRDYPYLAVRYRYCITRASHAMTTNIDDFLKIMDTGIVRMSSDVICAPLHLPLAAKAVTRSRHEKCLVQRLWRGPSQTSVTSVALDPRSANFLVTAAYQKLSISCHSR